MRAKSDCIKCYLPVYEPLQGLVGWFQQEVRTQQAQKLLNDVIQPVIDLLGLHGTLHRLGVLRKQRLLVLDKGRVQLQ